MSHRTLTGRKIVDKLVSIFTKFREVVPLLFIDLEVTDIDHIGVYTSKGDMVEDEFGNHVFQEIHVDCYVRCSLHICNPHRETLYALINDFLQCCEEMCNKFVVVESCIYYVDESIVDYVRKYVEKYADSDIDIEVIPIPRLTSYREEIFFKTPCLKRRVIPTIEKILNEEDKLINYLKREVVSKEKRKNTGYTHEHNTKTTPK